MRENVAATQAADVSTREARQAPEVSNTRVSKLRGTLKSLESSSEHEVEGADSDQVHAHAGHVREAARPTIGKRRLA